MIGPRTPEESARLLDRWRASLAEFEQERDDVDAMMDAFARAGKERTFSGFVRRAIHTSDIPLDALAAAAGVGWGDLEAFLAGTGDLPSSAIDRLVETLRIEVAMSPASREAE
ncbi:hypothetical protein [Planctellipticum variicoloris]|uniref:hypothetical protein n=1 Tax=Planctellipticum variicoloris TaxID=3064265 RepID=UPI0030136A14|nr:hypothetical protein SH412_005389 [Planctomycetaceae bacterium SH412]